MRVPKTLDRWQTAQMDLFNCWKYLTSFMWVENGKTVISYSLPESIILSGLADYNKLIQLLIHILKGLSLSSTFIFNLMFFATMEPLKLSWELKLGQTSAFIQTNWLLVCQDFQDFCKIREKIAHNWTKVQSTRSQGVNRWCAAVGSGDCILCLISTLVPQVQERVIKYSLPTICNVILLHAPP